MFIDECIDFNDQFNDFYIHLLTLLNKFGDFIQLWTQQQDNSKTTARQQQDNQKPIVYFNHPIGQ